jgi:hypothetical protein
MRRALIGFRVIALLALAILSATAQSRPIPRAASERQD